jgi:hypothetical protein
MTQVHYRDHSASGPFSQTEMDKFKRQMCVDMPMFEYDEQYVEFMRSNNGGQPIESFFQAPDGGWCSIDRILNFSAISQASSEDLLFNVHQNWLQIESRLDAGMFPFAALPGGDYLLFECKTPSNSPITFWYHEKSKEDKPFTQVVAASFAVFLLMLRADPRP